MTQATSNASRRKGSVSEKDSNNSAAAVPRRSQTPSRQDQKNGTGGNSNNSAGAAKGKMMSNARSTSAPKQRGRSSTGPSSSGSLPPPPSRYEVALARMKKESEGKSDEELQFLLQQLLQNAQFEDAAYLISASAYLDAKFKTSDVVRLMLEAKQFDQTAQLIRDMKLQSNQLLVTLFVKELVRCSQFHAAVRYAQEMVQNFGKKDFGPRDQERPSWTPQALIQAMLRAFQFKTALKFSKQFDLLDTFPALPLVANMFEARQWEDAISSVMEYRLFTDFPIEALIMKMLGERQWSLAVKCMGKIQQKELLDKYADALVREAARAGDFIVALRYLREYKLDQAENKPLLQFLVDAMITFGEMYKAIKYAIKFGLDKEDPEGEETGATPYATKKLIAKAIEIGQFHIATTYIKKLRLKDQFVKELAEMEQKQQTRLREFREFVSFREAQFNHPTAQHQLYVLIGDKIAADAMDIVELDPMSVDMVLSEVEEIIPRKKREVAGQKAEESVLETTSRSHDASLQSSTERQSRFNFARTSVPGIQPPSLPPGIAATQNSESSQQERTHAPPPGLAQFAQPAAPVRTEESSSSFNFAQFASALHSNAPPVPVPSPTHAQSLPTPPGMQHQQMQQNQQSAPMYVQHAPILSNHFGRGPIPPPPSFAPSYHQGNYAMQSMNPNQAPPPLPSYMMPPPPSVPSQQQYPSGNGNPGMDIASLAMQFHSSGNGRVFGAPSGFGMNNQGGAPVSYPPQMPPNAPSSGAPPALNHLFPSFVPPPPPPQFAPPPRSSFKPSIGYTSVTTTRQKK